MLGKHQPAISLGQWRRQGLTQLALTTDTLCNSLIFSKIHDTVNQIPCTILLDTGSSILLISQELLDEAHLTPTSVPQPVNVLTVACTDMVLCTSATIMLTIGSDIKIPNFKKFFLRIIRIQLWHTVDRIILQLKKARTKLQVSLSPQFKYYHSLMTNN